jgi:hypothetical protein
LLFFSIGALWFLALSLEGGRRTPPGTAGAMFFSFLYSLFGLWPPPVAMWGIGAAFLFQAWRERSAKRRLRPGLSEDSGNPATPTSIRKAATSANAAQLHRYLGTGLVLVSGVSLVLTYLGIAPILPAGTVTPTIAYAPSVIAVALLAVALFVLRPRVPGCPPGLSVEEFWSTPEMGGKVLPIWFLLEGGGGRARSTWGLANIQVEPARQRVPVIMAWQRAAHLKR